MYDYKTEREKIFTEDGQRLFLRIRDNVHALIKQAGACSMIKAIGGCTGDSWTMMACVDRLVELEEIREVPRDGAPGQFRLFVAPGE